MDFDKAIACMLLSAYGDMQGAEAEFMSLGRIRGEFGPEGVTVPQPAFGFPHPVVTDDTQMAIATGLGLLKMDPEKGWDTDELKRCLWRAYKDWFVTQRDPLQSRAPGSTCMRALRGDQLGDCSAPINSSAGCGGIMRAHPIGIRYASDSVRAFEAGIISAALTHGGPEGFIPAGCLAYIVAQILSGATFDESVQKLIRHLNDDYPIHWTARTLEAIRIAVGAPRNGDHGVRIDQSIGRVGMGGRSAGGWLGHDALAIALYAVNVAQEDPMKAVTIAVNHTGDSDSTGAIAGAIAGAMHGMKPLEASLAKTGIEIEHDALLREIARNLILPDQRSGEK